MLNETIAAISTGFVNSAISIIRVSGNDAIDIVNKIFSKNLRLVDSHTINYGFINDNGNDIDEVLVSVFKGPNSFTGEDIVEINSHGGIVITRKILSILIKNGARLANPGEFSQRAYLNGRIDLTQAESINDMIHSTSESDTILAMQGMKGSIQKIIDPFVKDILDIIANIEVNIDYPEYEDIEEVTTNVLKPLIEKWISRMDNILDKAKSGVLIKEGIKTAIVGKPNVGKSSLLNALLDEDKAIVSSVEGTTRDVVEGNIVLGDIKLRLLDTAGIRQSNDLVENIGIKKSYEAINDADLIIHVVDATTNEIDNEILNNITNKNAITVYNKSDLISNIDNNKIYINANNKSVDNLINEVKNMFNKHTIVLEEPTLNNERHIGLLNRARASMIEALADTNNLVEIDLIEINIQDAYNALKEISGIVDREDMINTLFSNFCLGK